MKRDQSLIKFLLANPGGIGQACQQLRGDPELLPETWGWGLEGSTKTRRHGI